MSKQKAKAEAFSLSGNGHNPVHKNVKISVENVNRFPIKHVIVFNKYITPLLKCNEMYQTFELKDFDGTPYYSLESINDI